MEPGSNAVPDFYSSFLLLIQNLRHEKFSKQIIILVTICLFVYIITIAGVLLVQQGVHYWDKTIEIDTKLIHSVVYGWLTYKLMYWQIKNLALKLCLAFTDINNTPNCTCDVNTNAHVICMNLLILQLHSGCYANDLGQLIVRVRFSASRCISTKSTTYHVTGRPRGVRSRAARVTCSPFVDRSLLASNCGNSSPCCNQLHVPSPW